MKKILGLLLALGMVASVAAANRVGPVSQYGQLQAGKNSSGQGRIYGSCDGVVSGKEVKVRGMSLFWSLLDDPYSGETAKPYYTKNAIDAMVNGMKIEIVRIAMGTGTQDWGIAGYATNPSGQEAMIETVVNAAIANDIYVIIDWHSHTAHTETDAAKAFFSKMARLYGGYDNVIFEIYNEPATWNATQTEGGSGTTIPWSTIKDYATQVIAAIREYSDNLIVVGTPSWSANVSAAKSDPIKDSNVAYTFHFYASSHDVDKEGKDAADAIEAGLPVFVTEWGTCEYTGNGQINSSDNTAWQDWMDQYDLSAANWAAVTKGESCSAFSSSNQNKGSLMDGSYYTASGSMVKGFLENNPSSYTVCKSSTGSSSSQAVSSSSSQAAGTTSVIDDFEDGDGQANNLGEPYWYIYVTGGASVSNTKTGDTWNMVASSGSDYYAAMTGISGVISGSQKYPGAGIGLDVPENSLANCTAITYKYKGSGHKFRAGISTVTADMGYEHVTDVYDASTGWTSVTVTASDLAQPDPEGYWIPASEKQTFSWALVEKMAWVVDEKLSNEQIGTELDIDDITCVGTLPVVESSSSGTSSSSGKSSSSGSETFSSSSEGGSSASMGAPGVIDDVEDGDGQAFSGGYWFAYTDKGDKGASIIGNDTDDDGGYVMVADGSNGTNYVVGMNGIQLNKGGNTNDPYVAMGLNLTLENMASNLSTCTEISYDYKGAAHNFKVVMAGDPKGELTGYDRHFVSVDASTGWTKATISWSALKQNGWGKSATLDKIKVSAFHWEVKGSTSVDYLYVDNFTCVGLNVADIALSSSSSATTPNSSSSAYNPYNPYSSSSYNPYNPYDPYGIAETQFHGSLKVSMAGSVLNVTVERAGLVKVHVFDMMGHAIESHVENMAAGTYGHSLANLSKGAYIVRVQQGSEQKVIRTQVR